MLFLEIAAVYATVLKGCPETPNKNMA